MEEVFTKRDLMMFLNEVKRQGIDHFTVVEPYFKTKMLEVEMKGGKYEVTLNGKNDFGPYPSKDKYWGISDIPDFYSYKDCLISSGLVKFDNWPKFEDWIGYFYKSEIDPSFASKSIFLSIDTNMAYYRLISRRFPIENNGYTITADDFDYLLSSIVEGEVDHHIKDKYSNMDLKMMGMYTKIGDIRYNFNNRGKLMTRKAKFATQELNYLRGKLNAARIKGNVSKTDSEMNDIWIIESLEQFGWTKNINVGLISSDRNMGNHAENAEIPYFILEIPHNIPRTNVVNESVIKNLLHDLALIFGAVKLPELETTIFGIWGGKTDMDYRNESVNLWVNPNSPLEKGLKKDVKILKSLKGP